MRIAMVSEHASPLAEAAGALGGAEAGGQNVPVANLAGAAREFLADPDHAREAGRAARAAALERYGLGRFLADWDALLEEVAA